MIAAESLHSQIKGPITEPDDPDYHEARKAFVGWVDRRPAHIPSMPR